MKKLMSCLAVGTFATVLGVASAPVAYAQSDRENSTFTLTEPLDVGSFTLQPGTYLIKVVLLEAGPPLNPDRDYKEHVWPYQLSHRGAGVGGNSTGWSAPLTCTLAAYTQPTPPGQVGKLISIHSCAGEVPSAGAVAPNGSVPHGSG